MTQYEIENRLERLVGIYDKLNEIIKQIPVEIPDKVSQRLVNLLMGDQDMKKLVESIKGRRPPRFLLMGRTGAGKSSLINAMCGKYLAETSDVNIGTKIGKPYAYKYMGKTIFEVIDTRGIGESLKTECSAEDDLKELLVNFAPDAILFLVKGKSRDYIDEDINVLKEIRKSIKTEVPVIVLSSQVDELEPGREKDPNNYSQRKIKNIEESIIQLETIFSENNVSVLKILPVSSYIEWSDDPNQVEEDKWHELEITFDGRYNINELLDLLENNIDLKAGLFLMLTTRLDQVTRKISDRLTKIFSGISAVIATTPIPLSDVFILTALQIVLIMIIAYLGGRDIDYDNAKELLVALGGAGVAGFTLRVLFQQGSKFFNLVFPGAGTVLSASVASGGTWAIGQAAKAYFIEGIPKDQLDDIIKQSRNDYKD